MSGHTKGPWEFVPFKAHEHASRPHEGDMGGFRAPSGWVCHFGDSETYYPTEGDAPNEHDARLIAAAPVMLETLQWLDEIGGLGVNVHERIRAAIRQATGGKP